MQEIPPDVQALVARIPFFESASHVSIAPLQDVISLNNANYRVEADGTAYLVRLGAETARFLGIDRDEEIAAAKAAASVGVGPKILYAGSEGGMVMPFIVGRHWKPEDFHEPSNMARVAEVLRRLHNVRDAPANTSIYGRVKYLLANVRLLLPDPPALDSYQAKMGLIEQERACDAFTTPGLTHGDFWANNFLDDGQRLWLLDWEFAGISDGLYDLATLSMAGQYTESEQQTLLDLYGYHAPDALENLRRMQWITRLFEAAWALVQHGLIVTKRREPSDFDYLSYANRMFALMEEHL